LRLNLDNKLNLNYRLSWSQKSCNQEDCKEIDLEGALVSAAGDGELSWSKKMRLKLLKDLGD
jgi:hypothetical protein